MKNYKLIGFLLLFVSTAFAQQGKFKEKLNQKKEEIKSLKVAYITNELNLTSDEAAKFWPLYNTFEDKQNELRKDKMKGYLDRINSDENLSEKEANSILNQMESTEDELYQLRKKFITNLKSVLPSLKILKLKKAEDGFNRKLLQQYRDKKNGK